jgi:hypothetical protein
MRSTLIVVLSFLASLMSSNADIHAGILIDKLMWENPAEYAIDRSFAKQWWNVDLFCRSHYGSQAYIGHRETNGQVHLENTIVTAVDPCFNRLLFMGQERNAIRSYGSCGAGTNQFTVPLAIDITAPISSIHTYSNYYNIYVADRDNNRALRLRYDWTNPDAGITYVRSFTGTNIVHPVDVDLDNAGTFYPDTDDFLWMACENNKIVAVNTSNGAIVATYGGTGSGSGKFRDIAAIACGRSFDRSFVNTDTLYVADNGNHRIVLLSWFGDTVHWGKTWTFEVEGGFTDLDVDNFGQLWLTCGNGYIVKFTSTLTELGVFTSGATGYQLTQPSCISNTGGYLGGGEMLVAERWTDTSGLRAYAISTDVTDLYANPFSHGAGRCSCMVYFTLSDYSYISVELRDSTGAQVVSGGPWLAKSGVNTLLWNGLKANGRPASAGSYQQVVTAVSLYRNKTTGQPVNSATKSVWFNHCGTPCAWDVGDANGDDAIDISDAVYIVSHIFRGGAAPTPNAVGSGDPDCSRGVDIADAVYLIATIFTGGPPPGNPDGIPPNDCSCIDYR